MPANNNRRQNTASDMPKGRKQVKKEATTRKAAEQITFKPQGKGPCKHTPKTIAEQQQLTNEQCFEPAKILAQQHKVGVLQFLVCWKGCSNVYDSWEPLVNIPGSEDLIRDYCAERVEKEAKDEAKRNEAEQTHAHAGACALRGGGGGGGSGGLAFPFYLKPSRRSWIHTMVGGW